MASSVRLHPLAADRVQSLEWQREDTTLAEIAAQLGRMSAKLAHREAGDDAHPHPRNCVMNMIALVHEGEMAMRVGAIMADLSAHHPSRCIVLYQHSREHPVRIDASVRTEAHALVDGSPIQHEQVILHVQGQALEHVRSLVEPLLIPDVRTHMWWTGTPPLTQPPMLQVLELCNTLVVDSAGFDRPAESLVGLAGLTEAYGSPLGIADFHWARIQAWRELTAQFFDPPDRRGYLAGIHKVEIDHTGAGGGGRVTAALLAGWLASTLGWQQPQSANAGQVGDVLALESADGKSVEVSFRAVSGGDSLEAMVSALRITAEAGGHEGSLQIEADVAQPGSAHVRIKAGDAPGLNVRIAMPTLEDAALLIPMLAQDRADPVYTRSLKRAAELLQTVRS